MTTDKRTKPAKRERAPKSNNAMVTRRINEVYQLLLDGLSRAEIIEYTANSKDQKIIWGISDSMLDEYIARATAEIKLRAATDRDEEYGKALERLRNLYARNILIEDLKAALAVQKEINELLGLYPTKRIEHGGKDGSPIEIKFTSVRVTKQSDSDSDA